MIEKVAKATYEKFNEGLIGCCEPAWRNLPSDFKFRMMEAAKAGIEVISEPNTAMKHAKDHNGDKIHYGYNCNICGGIEMAYKAMMKAALLDK